MITTVRQSRRVDATAAASGRWSCSMSWLLRGRGSASVVDVYAGPSAYSSLVALPDTSIGLLFERGERSPYERITFVRATLEWLTETGSP
jgi:hypothetical protein